MSPNLASATRRKSPTQPLSWDWVTDWSAIDQGLTALEARHLDRAGGESAERD